MGILNIELFNEEELSNKRIRYDLLIYWFNKINDESIGKVDQLSYMDYYKKSKEQLRVEEWIEFLSDYRVSMLLDKIMLINMRSNVNELMNSEDRSVAGSQKLSATLTFLAKYFDQAMNRESVQFIYTSVPLTKEEVHAKNTKTLLIKPKKNPYNPSIPKMGE